MFAFSIAYLGSIDYRIPMSTWNGYSHNNVILGHILLSLTVLLIFIGTKQKFPFMFLPFIFNPKTETSECMGNSCNPKSSSPGQSTDDANQNNRYGKILLSSSYHQTVPNSLNAARLNRDATTITSSVVIATASSLVPGSPMQPASAAIAGGFAGIAKVVNDRTQDNYNEKVNRVSENKNKEETKIDE